MRDTVGEVARSAGVTVRSTLPAAGVVLAGGRSSRMGRAKAALEWHGSTLLRRTCDVLGRAVTGPVVVVRAAGQDLPPLHPDVRVVDDPRDGLGPLQGLVAGLTAAARDADRAFVCATDLPFLREAFVRRVLAGFDDDADIVLPVVGGRAQPLAAGYRTAVLPTAQARLAGGRLRLGDLPGDCRTVRLDEAALLADPALAAADPGLDSVVNVNDPAEYAAARRRGLSR
ncbi:MAG TPA: molybdenum cofactor guanylyltransferase [Egibacteraceae bacterium]|nr:molybdenum cofactor guanylyltransferase [Egibacteraceae bacterium]